MRIRFPSGLRLFIALAVASPVALYAGSVSLPHTFSNGQTANADDVNENFSALATAVNDNHSRIGALEAKGSSTWWNASWTWRAPIVIRGPVPQGATLAVVLDHATLVGAGKSLATGNDVRIVFQDGSNNLTELDRYAPEWGGSSVEIEFRVQAAIANGETNARYWIYGGNAAAGVAPANRMNVYMLWEDFEDGDYTANPAWTLRTGTAAFVNWNGSSEEETTKVLRFTTLASGVPWEAGLVYTAGAGWTDYVVEYDLLAESAASYPGMALRVQNDSIANTTAWWFEMSTDTPQVTLRPQLNNVDGGWSYGGSMANVFGTGRWHHLRIAVFGKSFDARIDGYRYLQHTRVKDTDHVASGTISIGGHTAGHNSLWDNIKVTRYYAGDRIQTLGAVQDKP